MDSSTSYNVSRNAAQQGNNIQICIFVQVQGFLPCFLFVMEFQNLTVCKCVLCIAIIYIMLRLWTAERDISGYHFVTVRLKICIICPTVHHHRLVK